MINQNPMLQHVPAEFYSGESLKAAEAIRSSDYSLLADLLKQAPNVAGSRGDKNLPLLAWAMGHNDPKAFALLLEAGASPNDFIMVEDAKMSLLSIATGAESAQFFDLLLAHKADPDGLPETEPPLFAARYAHKQDRFERLLQCGADLNHCDKTGKSVLLILVLARDYQQALQLVRRGADVNVRMKNGTSIRKLIERYPLPSDTPQGRAQTELARLLR
jgi:ankyrin repeat protein